MYRREVRRLMMSLQSALATASTTRSVIRFDPPLSAAMESPSSDNGLESRTLRCAVFVRFCAGGPEGQHLPSMNLLLGLLGAAFNAASLIGRLSHEP